MTEITTNKRRASLNAALKAQFDAKAAEPVPDHMLDLVEALDNPEPTARAG